jgi:pimeloyl-ACP methyl ester carboxylesterase
MIVLVPHSPCSVSFGISHTFSDWSDRKRGMLKMPINKCKLIALIVGVSFSSSAALAQTDLPPFYQGVMSMKPEGKLGQVIKKEKISAGIKGAQAWRIAYISSDINNKKTISTAVVVAPAGKALKADRPVIIWSHGTTGTAASCGPSQVINPAKPTNLYFRVGGDSWTDYGLPALEQFIDAGYVVIGTDYQGLGSPGKHQYLVARTQGRDAINAGRAVGTMKETGAGKKAVAIGWSQGGGSTIAAAGQPDYIAQKGTVNDGLEFLGFVALAPQDMAAVAPKPTDDASAKNLMDSLTKTFSNNVFEFAHYGMMLWGIQAAYPEKLKNTDFFTEEGAKALNEIYTKKCIHASSDTISYTFGANYKTLFRPDVQNVRAWADAIQAVNVPNDVKPIAPVMIYFGNNDTTLPPIQHELYRKNMCGIAGANVGRMQLPGNQDHFSTPGVSEQFYLPWIKDRFAGKPVPDGCKGG